MGCGNRNIGNVFLRKKQEFNYFSFMKLPFRKKHKYPLFLDWIEKETLLVEGRLDHVDNKGDPAQNTEIVSEMTQV